MSDNISVALLGFILSVGLYVGVQWLKAVRLLEKLEREAREEAAKRAAQEEADAKAREELRGRMIGSLSGWER